MQRGVTSYTTLAAKITVFFPENQVYCQNCEFCYSDGLSRSRCRLTHNLVFDLYNRPDSCPLETEEENGTV